MTQHEIKQDQSKFRACSNPVCGKTYLTKKGNGNGYCCDPCEDQHQADIKKAEKVSERTKKAAERVIR